MPSGWCKVGGFSWLGAAFHLTYTLTGYALVVNIFAVTLSYQLSLRYTHGKVGQRTSKTSLKSHEYAGISLAMHAANFRGRHLHHQHDGSGIIWLIRNVSPALDYILSAH